MKWVIMKKGLHSFGEKIKMWKIKRLLHTTKTKLGFERRKVEGEILGQRKSREISCSFVADLVLFRLRSLHSDPKDISKLLVLCRGQ